MVKFFVACGVMLLVLPMAAVSQEGHEFYIRYDDPGSAPLDDPGWTGPYSSGPANC